jgi:hypothetical protein
VIADTTVVASKPVRITVPTCRWHHSVEMICGLQRGEESDRCQTVVDGRFVTAVTIYNPSTCVVTLVKYFAPLILNGKPVGREPRTVRARPFAKIQLKPARQRSRTAAPWRRPSAPLAALCCSAFLTSSPTMPLRSP